MAIQVNWTDFILQQAQPNNSANKTSQVLKSGYNTAATQLHNGRTIINRWYSNIYGYAVLSFRQEDESLNNMYSVQRTWHKQDLNQVLQIL